MIVCSCKALNQKDLGGYLPKLNPCLPLADIGDKSGAGSDCGSYRGDWLEMVAEHPADQRFERAGERVMVLSFGLLAHGIECAMRSIDGCKD